MSEDTLKKYKDFAKEHSLDETAFLDVVSFFDFSFSKLGLKCSAQYSFSDAGLLVNITGEDTNFFLFEKGRVLEAFQILALSISNKQGFSPFYLSVDVDGYRDKRKGELLKIVDSVIDRVNKNQRPYELEPMSQFERKIIHNAISEKSNLFSHSEGVYPNRYVVVTFFENQTFQKNKQKRHKRVGFKKKNSFSPRNRRF